MNSKQKRNTKIHINKHNTKQSNHKCNAKWGSTKQISPFHNKVDGEQAMYKELKNVSKSCR